MLKLEVKFIGSKLITTSSLMKFAVTTIVAVKLEEYLKF